MPGQGILAGLPAVGADNITPPFHPDLLDLQRDRVLGPRALRIDLPVASGVAKGLLTDLLDLSHPGAQNVGHIPRLTLQGLDRFGTDHAPVGHDAKLPDGEALLDPLDHRQQAVEIRAVARPHLTTDRAALLVQNRGHHHRLAVGAAVLAVTELAQALSPLAFEVDGGGIQKDLVQAGEEMTMS